MTSQHADGFWNEPRGTLVLWLGILLAPAAWAVNLQTSYSLAALVCEGTGTIATHVVTVLTLMACGAGASISWRSWRALPDSREARRGYRVERGRFMAASGIVLSLYFGLTILAQWIPTIFLGPCVS